MGSNRSQPLSINHKPPSSACRLRPEPFVALQAWLYQMQAFWTDQLDAFTYEQWACELPDSEAF